MSDKRTRQTALLDLTRDRSVATQEEMVALLRERGFLSTQSSISRDVRELGLVRINGRYVPAAAATADESAKRLPDYDNELIMYVEPVGANLIVVKTPPGSASPVAIDMDRLGSPDIVGTVAGDDTVFVAVRSRAAQGRVVALLPRVATPPAPMPARPRTNGDMSPIPDDEGGAS
jgi:transcriptional regulator of arginine metabolism